MPLPLSPSQEIVWFHEQLFPGGHTYHFTAVIDLQGQLDSGALRKALACLMDHHPGLRLALTATGETPARQEVARHCTPRFATADLTGEAVGGAAYNKVLREHATAPFTLHEAPLLRWTLVKLSDRHHRLLHTEHHLVHDGRSFGVLLHDLFTLYTSLLKEKKEKKENAAQLPRARSYEEFLTLCATARSAQDRRRSIEHWATVLEDAPTGLSLPGLARRPARGENGAQLRRHLDVRTASRLREVSRQQGHTPFVTLLTLFGELLRRHSTGSELVLGTAVDTRPEGFERTVGMFVNTMPVRLDATPERPAHEVVDDVTESVVRGLAHADAPIQEVTRALGRYAADLRNPLFRAMFSAHDAILPSIRVPGLDVSMEEAVTFGTVRFDIDVVFLPDARRTVGPKEGEGGMTLLWDYDADLLAQEDVQCLHERLEALVHDYLARPGTPLGMLRAAPDQATSTPEPVAGVEHSGPVPAAAGMEEPELLDSLFHTVAAHAPDRPALLSGLRTCDYGTLADRVERLARTLRHHGVEEGHLVACFLPRGTAWVVALLACLRLRAVACPLPPGDPVERQGTALDSLRPSAVIATAPGPAPHGCPHLTVDDEGVPVPTGNAGSSSAPPVLSNARKLRGAAYVIHTSGSTGKPKAVVVGREALASYVSALTRRYGLTNRDCALAFAQPWFDVSLEEILPTLCAGGSVLLLRAELPDAGAFVSLCAARGVTVANLPTSYFLAVRERLLDSLLQRRWEPRLLVLGGERLRSEAVQELCAATTAFGGSVLHAYGVTEATVTSTVHEVTAQDADRLHGEVPLGHPLPGTGIHVVDARRRPVPPGMTGEIAITGAGLADGYLDAPAAEAARFGELPAAGTEGQPERAYFSGDLGFVGADGALVFLGRKDNQVKLRGHRIELEEVESVARQVIGDIPCAVVHDVAGPSAPRLVGFYCGTGTEPARLGELIAERLPGALRPALWVRLQALPTRPGGKPDRTALGLLAREAAPAPAQDHCQDGAGDPDPTAHTAPQRHTDGLRATLSEAWHQVLGHGGFGDDSHFFRAGGHSLLVIHLVSWLHSRLGARPPLRLVFEQPVFGPQADALEHWLRAQHLPSA
ncbi:non-ribosomal peptide synthetase [Streptomyces rimosus]|uniref:non-ribosomal peptide synthetase n=1 Tax=Streptomyces rimosus TaxID=1927 RepID=UPI0004C9038A|nr:non-ribosomal peptide synthetase [Streptomyces rimosus]